MNPHTHAATRVDRFVGGSLCSTPPSNPTPTTEFAPGRRSRLCEKDGSDAINSADVLTGAVLYFFMLLFAEGMRERAVYLCTIDVGVCVYTFVCMNLIVKFMLHRPQCIPQFPRKHLSRIQLPLSILYITCVCEAENVQPRAFEFSGHAFSGFSLFIFCRKIYAQRSRFISQFDFTHIPLMLGPIRLAMAYSA